VNKIKYCKFCDKEKPEEDFCKSGGYIKNICKDCQNKKQKQIYQDSKRTKQLEQEIEFHKNNERIAIDCQNKLSEEIERLNNTINKFESWLIGWIENEQYCFMSNNPKDRCRREVYEEVLHHFKELKGSVKE
jgi:archaellum component FlaC